MYMICRWCVSPTLLHVLYLLDLENYLEVLLFLALSIERIVLVHNFADNDYMAQLQ